MIGIVAAMAAELKPLIVGWQQVQPGVWAGSIGSHACVAAADGMGRDAVTRACQKVFEAGGRSEKIDTLISVGWAGALSCGAKPPDAWEVSEVIDTRTGERFATGQPNGIRLVTLDHVADVEEKRRLAASYQAVMVDMEAATVGRLAQARGVNFLCCKGISDGATDRLPDFDRFISPKGQLRLPAFVSYVAVRPGYWRNLTRMGAHSSKAAANLAQLVRQVVERRGS